MSKIFAGTLFLFLSSASITGTRTGVLDALNASQDK